MNKKNNRAKACNEMIQSLNVSDEVKEGLYKIEKAASSGNQLIKSVVKDLFISCPSCKELSKIAKCYERIITCNSVYPVRGTRTYLELAFPSSGKDKDYMEFFASPKLAAATQNCFTGVFLISFEQWSGANELIRNPAFNELVKFINDNKSHISFVFHVKPEFMGQKVLLNEFSKYVNLYVMEHTLPDMGMAFKFVETKLNESGIELNKAGKQELKKLLEDKLDMGASTYKGYQTLGRFASNLQFELYVQKGMGFGNKKKTTSCLIGKNEVRMISNSISMPDETISCKGKLGFN